jgi:hypothetical protein
MVDALAKPAHVLTWENFGIYDVRAWSGYSASHMKLLSPHSQSAHRAYAPIVAKYFIPHSMCALW